MLIVRTNGTVTAGHTVIATNVTGRWWNLKMTNDTKDGGKIKIYADNALAATFNSRGPREILFQMRRLFAERQQSFGRALSQRQNVGEAIRFVIRIAIIISKSESRSRFRLRFENIQFPLVLPCPVCNVICR